MNDILGIHHITVMASDAQRNVDIYQGEAISITDSSDVMMHIALESIVVLIETITTPMMKEYANENVYG
jgi:hypothetical protein